MLKRLLIALLATFPLSAANAATLYDTTTGGTTFTKSIGWLIRDYRPTWQDATQYAAMSFSLDSDATVTGAVLALTSLAFWSDNYSLQILSDNGGLPGSTVIGEFSSLGVPHISQSLLTYSYTSVSGAEIALSGATDYWLYLFCQADCELTWWRDESNPANGANEVNSTYPYNLHWISSSNPAAMFRLTGTASAVPLPPAFVLLSSGVFSLILLGRVRRKNGSQ